MILLEAEAREKWCPMTRFIAASGRLDLASNRQSHVNDPWENCLASACMMWRWSAQDKTRGYCGLSGSI